MHSSTTVSWVTLSAWKCRNISAWKCRNLQRATQTPMRSRDCSNAKNRSTQAWVPRYRHLFVGIIHGLDKFDSHLALTNFTGYDNVAIQQTGLLPLRRGCSLRNTSTHGVRVS